MTPIEARIACIHGDPAVLGRLLGGRPVLAAMDAESPARLGAHVLLVDDRVASGAAAALRDARADARLEGALLLVVEGADEEARALADGVLGDFDTALEQAAAIGERARAFARGRRPSGAEERLLFQLWTRPEAELTPIRDWHTAALYRYPLLDALVEAGGSSERWIASLLVRQILEPVRLVDRVRLCPSCRSAHHNYLETCPECGAADVAQHPALHCFTCGHVASQERFRREGMLICPNCETQLRHIGSDYDRPLENWACNDCRCLFVEPEIRARCMGCGAQHATSLLVARDVAVYRLSEAGRMVARTGAVTDVYSALEQVNHVPPDYFVHAVDWMQRLVRRHPDLGFALLGIRLVNVPALVARAGHSRTLLLMDALADRLRECVRTTDLCTRTGEEQFWILLPQIDAKGVRTLEGRLASLLVLSGESADDRLAARVVRHLSAEGGSDAESGDDLLVRLASQLA